MRGEGNAMKILFAALAMAMLCCASTASAQEMIPVGTVLPVALNSTISSAKMEAGAHGWAEGMQDVPLPKGRRIRTGTKVAGHVIAVRPANGGAEASITLAFDRLMTSKSGV